jgi:DNA mismatch repair ATPase MutS
VTPEGGLKYDYKLVEGISSVKGGLQVLHDLGFPKAVVDCAKTY